MDSWIKSLIQGRLLATVLAFVAVIAGAFGFTLTDIDQKALIENITLILTGISGLVAFASKVREWLRGRKNA